MKKEEKRLENYLLDYCIATEEEIDLICAINGQNLESLEDILYVRTGYRSLDQIIGKDEEDEEEDEDYE